MFDTLLVANRGEIAVRILRSAQAMGLRTVAIYSDADAGAPHVALADVAVRIGPAHPAHSYLDPARILGAAARSGAQAVHPGYGFLSENADFAQAVLDAGLVWVGPPPSAIAAMGNKSAAKARMEASGVPCVPGFQGEQPTDTQLVQAAPAVGYPLLVKAAAGGGGRGMRRVDRPEDLAAALRSARAESAHAFGDDTLLLERLVQGARHVEVQIMADAHGTVLHMGERDCSVQRRQQKVIEEAPCPAVDPALRARLGSAACAAARAVDYRGAGTVEFLLAQDGAFYFLEMNTRLQVEHPVTEQITGLDLVALQLRVAQGRPLGLEQSEIQLRGHAIEARLYAEDPTQADRPQTGTVHRFAVPDHPDIRVDHGLVDGWVIGPDYDPMIAKIIATGPDRDTARRRLRLALEQTALLGLRTNKAFLCRILDSETFVQGQATTTWLESQPQLRTPAPAPEELPHVAAALWPPRWGSGLRIAHPGGQSLRLVLDDQTIAVRVEPLRHGSLAITHGPTTHTLHLRPLAQGEVRVQLGGVHGTAAVHRVGDQTLFTWGGQSHTIGRWDPAPPPPEAEAGDGKVRALMASRILAVQAQVGDVVAPGQALVVTEAMKLESTLAADMAGTVTEVRVAPGDTVPAGHVLVVLQPLAEEPS